MTSQAIYASKKVSIQEALSHIRSGDCIIGGTYASEPVQLYSHLHTITDRVDNVHVWLCNERDNFPFYDGTTVSKALYLQQCLLRCE